jgi:leucine efflux protein
MSAHAFGIINLWTYVLGAFVIILLPGPNSMYVLAVAARRGVRWGYRAACGVFVGDFILISLTAAGAASLLRANPFLFSALKYVGAAYLLYLGIAMLRGALTRIHARETGAGTDASNARANAGADAIAPDADVHRASEADETQPFRKALAISLLNPKAILFLLSFFVQFVDPASAHHLLPFFILGAILQSFSFLYLTVLIFSGARLATQFRRRHKVSAGAMGIVGSIFISFSVKLALATVS